MKPLIKGYQIDFSKIQEGYLASETVCTAKSRDKAKSKLFAKIKYDGWLFRDGEEITYLNIPVIRCRGADIFEFEGRELSQSAIDRLLIERKRIEGLDRILHDESIVYCYIKKRGLYYRPDSCGYTEFSVSAGVYTKEHAIMDAKSCNELLIIPIDIKKHNSDIIKITDDMKTRLIV